MCGLIRGVVVACGVAVGVAGVACSSNSGGGGRSEESQKAVVSLKDTRGELTKAKADVNDAIVAMDKLTAQGANLPQAFQQYTVAVKDVQAAGDKARARATAMRENGRNYIQKWEKESEAMQSPELRAGAAARRQRIRDNYEQITATGRSVRDAYQPFLRNLQEIQRALSQDLTPAGVDSAKLAIDKAKADGTALNERLDALIAQLDEVAGGMTGGAPVQPAQASQEK